MKVDLAKLREYKENKLVSVQEHPEAPYLIWNYTHYCQNQGAWDEITKMCRGLITDKDGNVIARPFDKFFNRSEYENPNIGIIPEEPFTLWDKLDGSLGILYFMPNGEPRLATRGSFTSEQAIRGTKILKEMLGKKTVQFPRGYTIMFEIIYPENRIVVDYGKEEKLVYLGARHIVSGKVLSPSTMPLPYKFESAKEFDMNDMFSLRENAEGFVLHYRSGLMVKVKYEEYVRLHRLVTGVTKRRIWDLLRNGQTTEELLDRVPEEFSDWVKKTTIELMSQFAKICDECHKVCDSVRHLETRKEQADYILANTKDGKSGIVFAMLDDKDYESGVWRLMKPAHEPPFREDM